LIATVRGNIASSWLVESSITRRAMLALLPASLAAQTTVRSTKGKPLPVVGEFFRFSDPITENPVVRLTNTGSASFLPAPANHFISVKERFLLFSSDRSGKLAPFQVDLRSGVLRQIGETSNLLAKSLCLDPKERVLYLIDDGQLKEIELGNRKSRTRTERVTSFSLSAGGLFVIRDSKLEFWNSDGPTPIADSVGSECWSRPGGDGCLFQREIAEKMREFWYTAGNGRSVMLAAGRIADPFWSPDGESILFLRDVPTANVMLSEIHEVLVTGGAERCVSATSQFASFAPNGNASVFVGASRSKAQPTVGLQLRTPQREMVLCEHHASHPENVTPVFSPDSRRVYFQSDHQGKPAIYSVNVELLVEPVAAAAA